MNRQVAVALAVGVAFGLAAVSGAVAFGTSTPFAATDQSANDTTTTDGTTTADGTQSVDGTQLATENGTLTLRAAADQTVSGRTDLAAGTTLSVRVQSADTASPFIRTAETTVAGDGTFAVSVNLSQVTDQPAIRVSVRHDGEQVANATGQVTGEATHPPTADADESTDEDLELVESFESDDERVANTSFVVDGDQLTLAAAPAAQLRGETDLEPGTSVSVRLRSSSGAQPFLRSQDATVAENGTFSATFNLSTITPGTAFEASAHANGQTLVTETGTVTECTSDCQPDPSDDTTADENDGESQNGETTARQSADADDWPSDDPWLAEHVVETPVGETARLALNVDTGTEVPDAATVVVGSEDVNYRIEATARDADDDGRIALRFDTSTAGQDGRTVSVGDGDEVTVHSETNLSSTLDPASYDISVYRGTDTDGEPVDVGTLALTAAGDS